MVKNDAGGNKGKGLARKHVNASKNGAKHLRMATQEGEKYAIVGKMLGNGMCYVKLLDGSASKDTLCIIRNKFKGRSKRDNIIDTGSWVLVGIRDWASKQNTCDLLEVYTPNERERLLKNESCFKSVDMSDTNASSQSALNVQFTDNNTMKYKNLLNVVDEHEDDELVQPRVYNMPSSSSEESEPDDEPDDEQDNEQDDEQDESDDEQDNEQDDEQDESDNEQDDEQDEQDDEQEKKVKTKFYICEGEVVKEDEI